MSSLFWHEHPKVHIATAQFCLTPSYKNDPKSQNVHVRWPNFVLQIPTKGHSTRKIFACGGSILPSNLTRNHKISPYSFPLEISDLNLHMNSYVIYIWILKKFICKFTYEFICPLFWILESRKNGLVGITVVTPEHHSSYCRGWDILTLSANEWEFSEHQHHTGPFQNISDNLDGFSTIPHALRVWF